MFRIFQRDGDIRRDRGLPGGCLLGQFVFLLVVVCLATILQIDAEAALRAANRKYKKRFQVVEETMRADKKEDFSEYTQEEQDAVWQKAKAAATPSQM